MRWTSSYASSFEKDLLSLPRETRDKAVRVIREILAHPFAGKKLKGSANRYSTRIGRDYRVVYSVYRKGRLIDFEFVGN